MNLRTRMMNEPRRRITPNDKTIFLNAQLLRDSGATRTTFTQEDIDAHTASELYEMAFGGSVSYFDSPTFDRQRKDENTYIANMTRTLNVEESIHECPRCRYTKIIVSQKQLRSGDEGMTTLLRCTKCGNEWRRD